MAAIIMPAALVETMLRNDDGTNTDVYQMPEYFDLSVDAMTVWLTGLNHVSP